MIVERRRTESREGLRHEDRRRAVPAADVGNERSGLQPGDDAVEGRQPLGHEVGAVVDGERSLGAMPEAVVVLVPADALAADEPLGQPLADGDGGVRALEVGDHGHRARVVGEHERVLGRQDVASGSAS